MQPEETVQPPWYKRVPKRYWGSLALCVVLSAFFIHDWDGFVFERTVRDLWQGKDPYTVAEDRPYFTYLSPGDPDPQWYAYPPLPMLLMALTFAPELLFDFPPLVERVLLKLPMVAGHLVLAVVAGAWARRLSQDPAVPVRVERHMLFNPFLLLVGPAWGMTDPLLMALLLAAVLSMARRQEEAAGLWFGLAVLIKPFPVLLAVPLATYFIHRHGFARVVRALPVAAFVIVAVCLPFYAAAPHGFVRQVLAFHLVRDAQGLTVWTLVAQHWSPQAVALASHVLVVGSLVVTSLVAPRFRPQAGPLYLLLLTAAQVLLWNRVLNEQYLTLVVAPLVILGVVHGFTHRAGRIVAAFVPTAFGIITLTQGYHFVTLIPPDVAMRVFGRPVDQVARFIGSEFLSNSPIHLPPWTPLVVVAGALAAVILVSLQALRPAPNPPPRPPLAARISHALRSSRLSLGACAVLLLLGISAIASPFSPVDDALSTPPFPDSDPLIGAFYYLWWQNPSHDPEQQYGNWFDVSQQPTLGFYTNTRGVHQTHATMMRESGIDFAVVSYHSTETERYASFYEEAAAQGLYVAPLMELNEIYDQLRYHPLNSSRQPVPYAAYKLTEDTKEAIVEFVLGLQPYLTGPAQLRMDGRPVVFFYDSYVSGFGFDHDERRAHAKALLGLKEPDDLRAYFRIPQEEPIDMGSLIARYPASFDDLYLGANASYWRQAHLALHHTFWTEIRAELEETLGPVFLVSGDAYNGRAGFEAGIVKSLVGLEVFDGSFIYSPSFTWGNYARDPYSTNFVRWEDRNIWLTAFANGRDRLSAYGIAPAYNDTGVRPNGFVIPAFPEPDAPSTYERSWESAKRYPPDWVLVATFNEFFEGSGVEPSVNYGVQFLRDTDVFAQEWRDSPEPGRAVHVIAHERSSRTHPQFSERDLPHVWGLRTIAAVARLLGDDALTAQDALDDLPADLTPLDLLVVDGGRDAYDVAPNVTRTLAAQARAGTPTIVLGPQVAQDLRLATHPDGHVLPSDCQSRVAPLPGQDSLERGDRLVHGSDEDAGFLVAIKPDGTRARVAVRCDEPGSAQFMAMKPWSRGDEEIPTRSDRDCLEVVVSFLFPELGARARTTCRAL